MLIDKDKPFYSVVQVAQLLGISADRLRTYDEENLVAPYRDSKGNKRLYSELDIEWLKDLRILFSKNGLNTSSFKIILKLLYLVPDESLNKITNDDIGKILINMKNNPNYDKLRNFYV